LRNGGAVTHPKDSGFAPRSKFSESHYCAKPRPVVCKWATMRRIEQSFVEKYLKTKSINSEKSCIFSNNRIIKAIINGLLKTRSFRMFL
jgi:hypothetical protein